MTVYYVSPYGNDSNNGLGPDPGHASNKPWLTLTKLLGVTGFSSGDTGKICPGVYRETVTVAMTSATAETKVTGDVDNASGFKDGSGNLVPGGEIIWTAYTTNDKTAPAAAATLNLDGRPFLTFEHITFVGGNANPGCVVASAANSTATTFTSCCFLGGTQSNGSLIAYTGVADVAGDWTIDRCLCLNTAGNGSSSQSVLISLPTSASADYDINVQVKNCLFLGGGRGVHISTSGASAFKGGGVDVLNCTFLYSASRSVYAGTANLSTSIPCTAYNCVIICSGNALEAATSGQLVEDYNVIYAITPRTNVSAGANSIASSSSLSYALLADIGQSMHIGRPLRPFLSPLAGSPLLGFGNQAGGPAVDAWNRIRPAGGAHGSYGVGYLERHDSWGKETTTTDAGGVGLSITGPGDQDLLIPVDAQSTTISIKMRRDTTYDETVGLPQAILLANGEIGITTETKTMTAADDTWETLTFSAQTPTAKGFVTVRLVSRDASTTGKTFADTLTATGYGTTDFAHFRRGEVYPGTVATAGGGGGAAHPGTVFSQGVQVL